MLMSFVAIISVTRHNWHYDALYGKWTQCLVSNRDELRAFFQDFRVTPGQAAHWLADGSSDATILHMLHGNSPFDSAELAKAAHIQEARLAASLMWSTSPRLGARPNTALYAPSVVPARSTHRPRQVHLSQAELYALTRQFEANARTAPFEGAPRKRSGKAAGGPR